MPLSYPDYYDEFVSLGFSARKEEDITKLYEILNHIIFRDDIKGRPVEYAISVALFVNREIRVWELYYGFRDNDSSSPRSWSLDEAFEQYKKLNYPKQYLAKEVKYEVQ